MPSTHKPVPIKPLTGALDFRLMPDEMAPEMMRFRQNFCCDDRGKVSRARGFSKFIGGNADYHDQLLPLQTYYEYKNPRLTGDDAVALFPNSTLCGSELKTRTNGREAVTFGMTLKVETGGHRTIIGTRSRLLALDETTRNYRIIGDGFGGKAETDFRFHGSYLNGTLVLSNGVDQPVAWPLDGLPVGCEMQAVKKIKDLDIIGLEKAGFVCEFSGSVFLFDITLDGVRFPNRYVWSDLNDGTSFDPAANNGSSITGLDQVKPGHTILAVAPLLGSLIVYTDHGIFRISATGSSPAFTNTPIYEDENGYKCLKYKNTLVSLGASHVYGGADGLYLYDPYRLEPDRPEWMHSASGVIYNGIPGYGKIDPNKCEVQIAEFKPAKGSVDGEGEIYFSWADAGHDYPTQTLVLNTKYEFAYTIDHGFTALFNFIPDGRISVRDFLLQACACSADELDSLGLGFVKEAQPENLCTGDAITCILNRSIVKENGYDTEDWSGPADSDSLCAYLGGQTADDLCGACEQVGKLVGASSQDWCLKEIGNVYYREFCTNATTPTGSGTDYQNINGRYSSFAGEYQVQGYYSVMRGAAQSFNTRTIKIIERFLLDFTAAGQSYPCVLQLRIGSSYHPTDPNRTDTGGPIWYAPERKFLEETDTMTPAEYAAQNIIPNLGVEFPLDRKGQWLYWELTIANVVSPTDPFSDLLPAIGGASDFSAIWQTVRQESAIIK